MRFVFSCFIESERYYMILGKLLPVVTSGADEVLILDLKCQPMEQFLCYKPRSSVRIVGLKTVAGSYG